MDALSGLEMEREKLLLDEAVEENAVLSLESLECLLRRKALLLVASSLMSIEYEASSLLLGVFGNIFFS